MPRALQSNLLGISLGAFPWGNSACVNSELGDLQPMRNAYGTHTYGAMVGIERLRRTVPAGSSESQAGQVVEFAGFEERLDREKEWQEPGQQAGVDGRVGVAVRQDPEVAVGFVVRSDTTSLRRSTKSPASAASGLSARQARLVLRYIG